MIRFRFELDLREADRFVRPMPQRQELVYRLAIRASARGVGAIGCFGKGPTLWSAGFATS